MDNKKSEEYKEQIGKELSHIIEYTKGFHACSAKDEQALAEILSMLTDIRAAIGKIEASHQRRMQLTEELARTLGEMENQHKSFAEKHGKSSPQ